MSIFGSGSSGRYSQANMDKIKKKIAYFTTKSKLIK